MSLRIYTLLALTTMLITAILLMGTGYWVRLAILLGEVAIFYILEEKVTS